MPKEILYDTLEEYYLKLFKNLSTNKLVNRLNREVGATIRTSATKDYLNAIAKTLIDKGVDISVLLNNKGSIELNNKIAVDSESKTLIIEN